MDLYQLKWVGGFFFGTIFGAIVSAMLLLWYFNGLIS